jgi:TetR/AcrR family transcriptional regulator, transcriptional repressor for nem operon
VRKGEKTRERILDIAETSVLQKGFGATSIDELIAEAELTKSGFFYHFSDKNALARALLQRHLERDDEILDDLFRRARELSDDPLHALLIGLKLFSEMLGKLQDGHPGCLVATYCYHERLFDREINELNASGVQNWRQRFVDIFEKIHEKYEPQDEVEVEALADMISTVVEGGIILSKVLKDPKVLADQVLLMRSYVKLLYQPKTVN